MSWLNGGILHVLAQTVLCEYDAMYVMMICTSRGLADTAHAMFGTWIFYRHHHHQHIRQHHHYHHHHRGPIFAQYHHHHHAHTLFLPLSYA